MQGTPAWQSKSPTPNQAKETLCSGCLLSWRFAMLFKAEGGGAAWKVALGSFLALLARTINAAWWMMATDYKYVLVEAF